MPSKPEEVSSDVLSQSEIAERVREINARKALREKDLSPYATRNNQAVREETDFTRQGGGGIEHEPFDRDKRRIMYSNAYERLDDKTQVCTLPLQAHISTRGVHSDRVAELSSSIARSIGANEDLAEAIARGHDIGHAPFGHLGEVMITQSLFNLDPELIKQLGTFKHNIQGVHVVDRVATRRGLQNLPGLNLTDQVRHGTISHDGETDNKRGRLSPNRELTDMDADIERYMDAVIAAAGTVNFEGDPNDPQSVQQYMDAVNGAVKRVIIVPATLEACIVYFADTMHYLPEDFEDMIDLGEIDRKKDLPKDIARRLGKDSATMIRTLVSDLTVHSYGKDEIGYSPEVYELLREFKYKVMYPKYKKVNSWVEGEKQDPRIQEIGFIPQEGMNLLFRTFLSALRDPSAHTDSPILTHFFKGINLQDYLQRINRGDASMVQAVVDYIAGFTDKYFVEQVKKIRE